MPLRNQHRERDRKVFEGWIADHRGIIMKIVRSFTADPTDADDLIQDISLALWRSIPSFRGDAKHSTWVWRIALNQAISSKRKSEASHVDLDNVAEPETRDRSADGLLVDQIYEAIRTLTPVDRSLIMLSLEGYRYSDISEITGHTETNVDARLSRARIRLNSQLKETQ